MTKYVFVTGGVTSSLGKGITAASLARILKSRGLSVVLQKLDPYINVDPGTMNPFEHGEVFVTEDGGETDLDLGHYERFLGDDLRRDSNVTTGSVYQIGDPQGAAWRLPGRNRAGDSAHHQRDQDPHPQTRRRGRRCGHHRDRGNGRRHRRAAVPRGDPADAQGRRQRATPATSTSPSSRTWRPARS